MRRQRVACTNFKTALAYRRTESRRAGPGNFVAPGPYLRPATVMDFHREPPALCALR